MVKRTVSGTRPFTDGLALLIMSFVILGELENIAGIY